MKIYLVQHGEAASKETDPQRPLTAQGRADVQRVADALRRADIRLTRVLHSGKLRARQTAELLTAEVAPGIAPEARAGIDPNDDPSAFDPGDFDTGDIVGDTLIVGHLPFMARLVAHLLTGDGSLSLIAFEPGSVVCLESNPDGHWQLNWMVRPDMLA